MYEVRRQTFNPHLLSWENQSLIWATPSTAIVYKGMEEGSVCSLPACWHFASKPTIYKPSIDLWGWLSVETSQEDFQLVDYSVTIKKTPNLKVAFLSIVTKYLREANFRKKCLLWLGFRGLTHHSGEDKAAGTWDTASTLGNSKRGMPLFSFLSPFHSVRTPAHSMVLLTIWITFSHLYFSVAFSEICIYGDSKSCQFEIQTNHHTNRDKELWIYELERNPEVLFCLQAFSSVHVL